MHHPTLSAAEYLLWFSGLPRVESDKFKMTDDDPFLGLWAKKKIELAS